MCVLVENRSPVVLLGKIKRNVLAIFIGSWSASACVAQEEACQFDRLAPIERRELAQFFIVAKCDDLQWRCVDVNLFKDDAKRHAHLFKPLRDFAGTFFATICGNGKM